MYLILELRSLISKFTNVNISTSRYVNNLIRYFLIFKILDNRKYSSVI